MSLFLSHEYASATLRAAREPSAERRARQIHEAKLLLAPTRPDWRGRQVPAPEPSRAQRRLFRIPAFGR